MKAERECVYCGGDANTEDHIPSKNLFPKGIGPKKSIKVLSCLRCNRGFSLDEEWFRYFVCSLAEPYSFYARQVFFSQIKRSVQRRPQIGHKLGQRMKLVQVRTEAGLYLGKATQIELTDDDLRRFDNVLDKYVKGLFFYESNTVLSDEYSITHCIFITSDHLSIIASRAKHLRWNFENGDIFSYGFAFVQDSYKSVWVTVFYDSVVCESFVHKPEDMKSLLNSEYERLRVGP